MTPENRQLFEKFAAEQMPREACAILVETARNGQKLICCRNTAERDDQFSVHPQDYLRAQAEGAISGIVHSHVYTAANPSAADRVACEMSRVPWYICSVPTNQWVRFGPVGFRAPLIGREFHHGVLDCYSLIRDYYHEHLKVELPDFDREYQWWDRGMNLYADNFAAAGFWEVEDGTIQVHDVLLMQIKSDVINHGAIYLGDEIMLHHLSNRLSAREVFGGFYKKHTVKVLRHGPKNQTAR